MDFNVNDLLSLKLWKTIVFNFPQRWHFLRSIENKFSPGAKGFILKIKLEIWTQFLSLKFKN